MEYNNIDEIEDDEYHYSDVTVAQSSNRRSADGDDSVDVSDNDYGYDLYYGDRWTGYFHSTTGIVYFRGGVTVLPGCLLQSLEGGVLVWQGRLNNPDPVPYPLTSPPHVTE